MNPYAMRSAIKDPDMFFGRTQEQKMLASRLNSMQSCAIVGQRRMGKSSLLTHLCRESVYQNLLADSTKYIFAYIDLQELAGGTQDDFFELALNRINRTGKLPFLSMEDDKSRRGFGRFLERASDAGYRIVLCCDEFEELSTNQVYDAAFFSYLRALASRHIALVTASRTSLFTLCHQGNVQTSQFWNIFSEISLGPLTPDASRQLVRIPFERAKNPIAEKEIERVIDLAGEHPFFLQVACFHRFENPENESAAVEAAFMEEALPHYRYTWDHLDPPVRQSVLAWSQTHLPLAPSDVKTLQQAGFLRITPEGEEKRVSQGWASFLKDVAGESTRPTEKLETAPIPLPEHVSVKQEPPNYLDFDLLIEPVGEHFRARVLNAPAGHGASEFEFPFSDMELENFLLRMGHVRTRTRRIESPQMDAAKTLGGRLFQSVFSGTVQNCFQNSLSIAAQQGSGLRLKLHLGDSPRFLNLPWEYLYNKLSNRFFALSVDSPVTRFLELPERIAPLPIQRPLRILVMISSPSDYIQLNTRQEWENLLHGLQPLVEKGLVRVDLLEQPTMKQLHQALRREKYHVLHYIGHSGFDNSNQDGVLLLENQTGRGQAVSGQDLGMLLHDEKTLYLVVLNSCEGARTANDDPFAGVAQAIVQQMIPAVVAMQFEITDDSAIVFSQEFYDCIANGFPVDVALTEARKAIFATGSIEWGTPVLYTSAPDGRVFSMIE